MGVYSSNRTNLGTYSGEEIVANENYSGIEGAFQIMTEGYQNDLAIFNSVIMSDFQEAALLQEGAVEQVQVLQEANVSGFIDKIKEFIKKVWEKIKGLFKTFFVKIESLISRDTKKFAEKYKKEVFSKDLSKMKFKFRKRTGKSIARLDEAGAESKVAAIIAEAEKNRTELKKLQEMIDDSDFSDNCLSEISGIRNTTYSDFHKDYMETIFEDEDQIEGLDTALLSEMYEVLTMGGKALSELKKENAKVDKVFSNMLRSIDKIRTEVMKSVPQKDGVAKDDSTTDAKFHNGAGFQYKKGDADSVKFLNCVYKIVQVSQSAVTKISGTELESYKFYIAQCKRVYAQAVSFNPKSVKEDAVFIEAVGDAAEYELLSEF